MHSRTLGQRNRHSCLMGCPSLRHSSPMEDNCEKKHSRKAARVSLHSPLQSSRIVLRTAVECQRADRSRPHIDVAGHFQGVCLDDIHKTTNATRKCQLLPTWFIGQVLTTNNDDIHRPSGYFWNWAPTGRRCDCELVPVWSVHYTIEPVTITHRHFADYLSSRCIYDVDRSRTGNGKMLAIGPVSSIIHDTGCVINDHASKSQAHKQ
mmetsp:Transcript_69605/g.132834  ORF Transcript_69605/g.132834 Transcript_69605/m.132834 type:complete len:207 (+) Transcript_69605:1-621(+)